MVTPCPCAVSEELYAPVASGVELCYQTFGSPDGDPLVLVMGLGGPMNWWDPELCTMLAEAGFHVVRFDNRDTGRSSRLEGRVTRGQLVRSFLGKGGRPPYTLSDMADDAFGLMDHLGWDSAHIVGVSMGGMIVQTMAVEQPKRVRSMTSIMSTLGKRTVGWQHPSLLPQLIGPRAAGSRGVRRQLGQDVAADRIAGLSQRAVQGPQAGRGDLRPRHLGQRGDAADGRDPQPDRPVPAAARR